MFTAATAASPRRWPRAPLPIIWLRQGIKAAAGDFCVG
jgi:hypothetical protein